MTWGFGSDSSIIKLSRFVQSGSFSHNHDGNHAKLEAKIIVQEYETLLKNDLSSCPKKLLAQTLNNIDPDVAKCLPPTRYLLKRSYFVRPHFEKKKAMDEGGVSYPLDKVIIPKSIRDYKKQDFLLFDSFVDSNTRILCFGLFEKLYFLKSQRNWCADGTFKVVPKGWKQLYVFFYLIFQFLISIKLLKKFKFFLILIKDLFIICNTLGLGFYEDGNFVPPLFSLSMTNIAERYLTHLKKKS